jgi:hypothetical protein
MAKAKGKPFVLARQPLVELEDLRDDCIAVMLNSGQSLKRVHERGGPTPQTTSKWLYRETRFPQLATIRAMLKACDHDLVIVSGAGAGVKRIGYGGISMPTKKTKPKKVSAKR